MALGRSKVEPRFEDLRVLLGDRLRGIYLLLADHGGVMFADYPLRRFVQGVEAGTADGASPDFGDGDDIPGA